MGITIARLSALLSSFRVRAGLWRAMSPAFLVIAWTAHAAQPTERPVSLVVSYRCDPAARPAFRRFLADEEMERLAGWQRQGVMSGYQLLFNPVETEDTWDAMLVLRFGRFADTAKWMAVERDNPGGLSATGLALCKPNNSYVADVAWEGGEDAAGPDQGAFFYVIPYEYHDEKQYKTYFEGYVLPQIKGWMGAGVLTGYRILLNRYPVGKPWDALFIYRYRDIEAFGQRDQAIAATRRALQANAEWVKWSENKSDIRTEGENIVAEALREER